MATRSNVEWKFWGKRDPLWGVAAWKGRNREGPNPWTDEEFYALGASDWQDFLLHWQRFGVAEGVAVEIGCGAGRLTKHMAAHFRQVHALDVSEDMIAYARKHVERENVSYAVVDGSEIPRAPGSVDAVFSAQVFQHLDQQADVENYLREISRVLMPGGTMMIHVPVFAWPVGAGDWVKRLHGLGRRLDEFRANRQRRRLERGGEQGLMRMRAYPIRFFYQFLPTLDFVDIEINVFATRSNNDPHPFVLARKAHERG
jgi:SAM-dependent methyltransferase